jgi:hypothetical protein
VEENGAPFFTEGNFMSRKEYTVYKAVRRNGKDLVSVSPAYNDWKLTYRLNEYTRRVKGTPGIFVFTSVSSARAFNSCCPILECRTTSKPVKVNDGHEYYLPASLYHRLLTARRFKDVLRLWSRPTQKRDYNWTYPYGTHVVEGVIPIRLVG